jgi:hypothetical protein
MTSMSSPEPPPSPRVGRLPLSEAYAELTAADLAHRWRDKTVVESVDEAVACAGAAEEYATADSALRWLLRCGWADLQEARQTAINGRWSIRCDHLVTQIVGLTRLVGPASWEILSVDLILDGVYERVHEAMGAPTPLSDSDRDRARQVLLRRTHGGRAT